jgi:hypothetical protein
MTQFKPKDTTDTRLYAPERDLAYNFLPAMRLVLQYLNATVSEDPASHESAEAQAATALVRAIMMFTKTPGVSSMQDALEQAGFMGVDAAVRARLLEKLGLVMLELYFTAARDITIQGQPSPQLAALAELQGMGQELLYRLYPELRQRPVLYADPDTQLVAENGHLRRTIVQQAAILQEQRQAIQAGLVGAQNRVGRELSAVTKSSGLLRIWNAISFAWRLYWHGPAPRTK